MNRHFLNEDIKIANKHIKRFSTLPIMKMKMKATIVYYLLSIRMPNIRKGKIPSFIENMKKLKPSCPVGGNMKYCRHSGNNMVVLHVASLKSNVLSTSYHFFVCPKTLKVRSLCCLYSYVHSNIYNSHKVEVI